MGCYEGHEGHEGSRHEGHEEGQESQRHREGKACQGCSLQGQEGEDGGRLDEKFSDQEQGCILSSQEGICYKRAEEVGRRMQAGTQSIGHQRLLCCWWEVGARQGFVCQSQGHPRQVRLAVVNSVFVVWLRRAVLAWTFHTTPARGF